MHVWVWIGVKHTCNYIVLNAVNNVIVSQQLYPVRQPPPNWAVVYTSLRHEHMS